MTKREKIQIMIANGMTYRQIMAKTGIKSTSTIAYYAGRGVYVTRKTLIKNNKLLLDLVEKYQAVCDQQHHELKIFKNFMEEKEMKKVRRIARKLTT